MYGTVCSAALKILDPLLGSVGLLYRISELCIEVSAPTALKSSVATSEWTHLSTNRMHLDIIISFLDILFRSHSVRVGTDEEWSIASRSYFIHYILIRSQIESDAFKSCGDWLTRGNLSRHCFATGRFGDGHGEIDNIVGLRGRVIVQGR